VSRRFVNNELREPDVVKCRELARRRRPVTTLHDATHETKHGLLQHELNEYVSTNGTDPRDGILTHNDSCSFMPVTPGVARFLSTAKTPWAKTVPEQPNWAWTLIGPAKPADAGALRPGATVTLKTPDGRYLDAQQGADGTYDRGDALTAATPTNPIAASTPWTIELVNSARDQIVDRNHIRLRSHWQETDADQEGYLLGEANLQRPVPRVYALRKANQAERSCG
jgi:hypothetical protein